MTQITWFRMTPLLALALAITFASGPARAEFPADAAAELARARQLEAQGGHAKEACEAFLHASELAHGRSSSSLLGLSRCFTRLKEGNKAVAMARRALAVAATPEERRDATSALGFDLLGLPNEAARTEALALFQDQAAGTARVDGQRGLLVALLCLHRDQEAAELLRSLRAGMSEADLQNQILNLLSYPGPMNDTKQLDDFNERLYRLSPDVPLAGGKVTRPEIRTQTRPEITDEARTHHGFSGAVILQTILDKEGKVGTIRVVQGQPMGLTENAEKTFKTWTFKPATLDGKPVRALYEVTITFKVP